MVFFGVCVLIVFICKFDELCSFCTPVGLMAEWKLAQNASNSSPLKHNIILFIVYSCNIIYC